MTEAMTETLSIEERATRALDDKRSAERKNREAQVAEEKERDADFLRNQVEQILGLVPAGDVVWVGNPETYQRQRPFVEVEGLHFSANSRTGHYLQFATPCSLGCENYIALGNVASWPQLGEALENREAKIAEHAKWHESEEQEEQAPPAKYDGPTLRTIQPGSPQDMLLHAIEAVIAEALWRETSQ